MCLTAAASSQYFQGLQQRLTSLSSFSCHQSILSKASEFELQVTATYFVYMW